MVHKVVSEEYRALMRSVQRQAQSLVDTTTFVPYHKCADCDNMVMLPRVYCHWCEMKGCNPSGCGSSRNPRGMLIYYGYEEFDG